MSVIDIQPGMRVRITQSLQHRQGAWTTDVVGTILSADPKPTGSWYAHGKNDKYWLLRITLQKDDGEITSLVLDQNTAIAAVDEGSDTT